MLQGTLTLGLFGIGAALPLVGVAYLSRRKVMVMRDWLLVHAPKVKKGVGILIGLTGVAILMGWDKRLEAFLLEYMPDWWIRLTVGI